MAISMLDRAIYSYSDVDRLVGVRPGTARRWLDGYERGGRFYEPVLRAQSSGSDAVTWGEMVEARLLAEFRDRRVPIQRLRPAVLRLREEFGPYPLAQSAPFIDVQGRELVRRVQEEVGIEGDLRLVVVRSGDAMLALPIQRFHESVEYSAEGAATRLTPIPRVRSVVMDPRRSFGQPAVRGVRTESLAEDYRAGSSREQLAHLYDLSSEQVDDAIRFELISRSEIAA